MGAFNSFITQFFPDKLLAEPNAFFWKLSVQYILKMK